jgi:lysozyme family protein
MRDGFDDCIPVTLRYEGGNDNDPRDPGGRTSRGITQREWSAYTRAHSEFARFTDVWTAPQRAIIDIYRTQYWDSVCGSDWPKGCDLVVFDAGVNSGIGKSAVWARSALGQGSGTFVFLAAICSKLSNKAGFIERASARRLAFLEGLRTWKFFGGGWRSRVAGTEAIALRWAYEAAGHDATTVAVNLGTAAKAAERKQNTAGGGVATTSGAAGAHQYVWTGSWLDWALVIGAILVIVWLVHVCLNHNARMKALVEESGK